MHHVPYYAMTVILEVFPSSTGMGYPRKVPVVQSLLLFPHCRTLFLLAAKHGA